MFASSIPIFQSYLLPAMPFRRRKSSADTTTSSASNNSHDSSSTDPLTTTPSTPTSSSYLTGYISTIACSRCHADIALTTQIISKGFTGRHGRAYLVAPAPVSSCSPNSGFPFTAPPATGKGGAARPGALPNTHTHKPVSRHLVTGMHTVCDVSCGVCGSVIGWKYVGAEEEAQRYKVGKFILESRRTVVGSCWENDGDGDSGLESYLADTRTRDSGPADGQTRLGDVMFDSEDEDECEDLFAGVWSPALARKRRNQKVGLRE